MRGRFLRKGWLILFALCGFAMAAFLLRPQERPLLDIARPLKIEYDAEEQIGWVSDHELLVRHDGPADKKTYHDHILVAESYVFEIYDVEKRTKTLCNALTDWFNQQYSNWNYQLTLSPDGKRLLLWQNTMHRRGGGILNLDGTGGRTWEYTYAGNIGDWRLAWMSDSQRWSEVGTELGKDEPSQIRIYRVDDVARKAFETKSLPSNITSSLNCWVVSPDRLLSADWEPFESDIESTTPPSAAQAVTISETLLAEKPVPAKTHEILLPKGYELHTMRISPNGDRIVWVLDQRYIPSFRLFLKRWFPRLEAKEEAYQSLWVSRTDGCAMRELGRVSVKPEVVSSLEEVNWLPGGKRLAFVYENHLFTVTTE